MMPVTSHLMSNGMESSSQMASISDTSLGVDPTCRAIMLTQTLIEKPSLEGIVYRQKK